jgi:pimeloyl-ACP methyl ester carboxylesterase
MYMTKVFLIILAGVCLSPVVCSAARRSLPSLVRVESLSVGFNEETIRAFCLFLDARSSEEREADARRGSPAGPVIVFFQGHAQRPDDAYGFTSKLALLSKSGMVIIPVCDTPFGTDPSLHGDNGKDVILMEIVRFVLAREGIAVSGYTPRSDARVTVDSVHPVNEDNTQGTKLASVGWSHGGILARRFAHAYPGSVCWLGQVCPAGYEHWGPWRLTGRFAKESIEITSRIFSGHAADALRSGWGFTKGFTGDFFRSVLAAVVDRDAGKVGRVFKDIKDCTLYCDSSRFKANQLQHIAVIFGKEDSCMNQWRQFEIKDPDAIKKDELKRFQEKFFSDMSDAEGGITLRILPGSHLAPVLYSDLYVKTLLTGLGQNMQD